MKSEGIRGQGKHDNHTHKADSNISEDESDSHSEPQDESDKDEQEGGTRGMQSVISDHHCSETQTAFEMTPVKTMKEKTKDAAALASRARETFLHQIQASPQAPPRPSPAAIASRTLAKAAGDLNNFEPEDWARLTVQGQEWFNTKLKPAIKELKRLRRTAEWDTATAYPNPRDTLCIRASNLAAPHENPP